MNIPFFGFPPMESLTAFLKDIRIWKGLLDFKSVTMKYEVFLVIQYWKVIFVLTLQ